MRGLMYHALLLARGRHVQLATREFLQQAEGLSAAKVRELQEQRLRELMRHAYENVPYYRKELDKQGGLELGTRNDATAALMCLPMLTKRIIRENWEELKARDLERRDWFYNTSGGSTGEPVKLVQDHVFRQQAQAVKEFFDLWTGYRVGMPKVVLWGSERDLLLGKETWKTRCGRWLRNEHYLNAFRMGPAEMRNYVKLINAVRPAQILAYVEAMYELAKFAEREGLEVRPPRAVMTSAGTLYGHMRKVIERALGAPVFNRYGSREVGNIACECETHEGLHVCPLTHYVEIVREDGSPALPGEVGEVVVTSLTNHAMPLIRYRIGDMAAWAAGRCSCGRNWPLLERVVGRTSDIFVSASGKRVHGEFFTHLLDFRDWVKKFQFVQETTSKIRLLVVPTASVDEARLYATKERAEIEEKIRIAMEADCELAIEFVEDIPTSPSGKYRYTISKVTPND